MIKLLNALFIMSLIVLSGCGGYEVPYKKYGDTSVAFASGVGYSDFEIGKNKYKVTYTGGVYDSSQKVTKFAYQRAKELCSEKGFSDYSITNTTTDRKNTSSESYGGNIYKAQDQKSQSIYSLDVECKK